MAAYHYLCALTDGGGTVPPELGVARRLVQVGHRVTVLADDTLEADAAGIGATFRRWESAPNRASRRPEDDPLRDWECRTPFSLLKRVMDRQLAGPAGAYAADVTAAVHADPPDAALCSAFAIGAGLGVEAAGVPYAVMLPNAYVLPARGMPPMGLGLEPARGPLGRARDRAISELNTRVMDTGLPRVNAVRTAYGLTPLRHFWDQVHHASRVLVLTSPTFDFPAELPDNVRYVGSILDDPAWAGDWSPPAGDEPLVLVGLSSTFQDHVGTLQRIADALGQLPVRGLITTGPAVDPDAVVAPPNVTVAASAPHSVVMQQAAAVVTHGGHGTVVKALAAGAPLLVLPHGRDQVDNAVRVRLRGAGLTAGRKAPVATIARHLRTLLDEPAYRTAAGQLGEAIRADADSGALARELQLLPTLGSLRDVAVGRGGPVPEASDGRPRPAGRRARRRPRPPGPEGRGLRPPPSRSATPS